MIVNISRTKNFLAENFFARPKIFLFENFCKDFEFFSETFLFLDKDFFVLIPTFFSLKKKKLKMAQNVRELALIFG